MRLKLSCLSSFAFFTLLTFKGCIETYKPDVIQTDFSYLVVEGSLISGKDSTILTLSRTRPMYDQSPIPYEAFASAYIEDKEGLLFKLTENKNGKYFYPPFEFNPMTQYRLNIKTQNNKQYYSAFVPLKTSPPIDSLTWSQTDGQIRFFVTTHDPSKNATYYQWTYDETWKYNSFDYSQYVNTDNGIVGRVDAAEIFYCWKTRPSRGIMINSTERLTDDLIKDYEFINIADDSRMFYYGFSMLVKQRALTHEAYHYWLKLKNTNENLGTLYDPIPGEDEGNLYCESDPSEPVVGFFSASTVTEKRVYISRQALIGPADGYEPTGYENCDLWLVAPTDHAALETYLISKKSFDLITFEFLGYLVSTVDCIDCRARGGTTARPSFWEE